MIAFELIETGPHATTQDARQSLSSAAATTPRGRFILQGKRQSIGSRRVVGHFAPADHLARLAGDGDRNAIKAER
jgi:hypothetical protein